VDVGYEGTHQLRRDAAECERSHPLFSAQVTIAVSSSVCPPGLCDTFLFPALDPAGEDGYEASAAAFAVKPRSRGSVRLTSLDPRAPLAIDHGSLSDPSDAEVLSEGVEAFRRLAGTDAISGYAGGGDAPGGRGRRADPRARGRTGLLPPGRNVRDRSSRRWQRRSRRWQRQVYGVDGLFVADASIMPAIPRANTTLSTLAVAERVAEGLAGRRAP
jgi:choline dehydrogenase